MKKIFTSIVLLLFLNNSFSQTSIKFDSLLSKHLSTESRLTGKWTYYRESANTQKIYKREINKIIPSFVLYQASLTNMLGWHFTNSTCLILYDTINSNILLVEPMWFSDQNKNFLDFFIGVKFRDSTSLLKAIHELQDLLIIGTKGKFDNTQYTTDKITFNLTLNGNEKSETLQIVEVMLEGNSIKSFNFKNQRIKKSRPILLTSPLKTEQF